MVQVVENRRGEPSIAILPSAVLVSLFSALHSAADRNRVALVCRAFRFYERQTRRMLVVRAFQRQLGLVPLCFSHVVDLDLSAVTLFPLELPSLQCEKVHRVRLARAFPNVRTLKVMAMTNDSVRLIGRIWPLVENLSFVERKELHNPPQLRTVLETFRHCEVLDARNLKCDSVAKAFSTAESLVLKSLNFESSMISSDLDIEIIATKCTSLESLSITIFPGRVMGDAFLKLASNCKKLSKLRLFLFLDAVRQFNVENARKCLSCLSRMTADLPDIEIHISFQHIPSIVTGYQMECLLGMSTSIRSLVMYTSDAEMKGLWSCKYLTELTFGSCEGLGDMDLVSVVKRCPNLHTLRLFNCKRLTRRGLRDVAEIAKLSSLSLCFLRISVNDQLRAVKPLCGSLSAIRLMVTIPVDSLCGLSGWSNLNRLEVTCTTVIAQNVLLEPWLESCPNLKHLGFVFQDWCPSTLSFLSMLPDLPSLSLSFSDTVAKDVLLSFLEDIALLPRLSTLSLFISNDEWLSEEAGALLARCPKLKSLNIIGINEPHHYLFRNMAFNIRPFLLQLLGMKCLQNVQLPKSSVGDFSDMMTFYQGLHAHTTHSIMKSFYDLKARDGPSRRKSIVLHVSEPSNSCMVQD